VKINLIFEETTRNFHSKDLQSFFSIQAADRWLKARTDR